jgi:LPS O-antigen subunit length determinant protein (WzzB/FepE family)
MKKQSQSTSQEEIDLPKIILTIWKEKVTFFVIVFLITTIAYVSIDKKKNNDFISTISVRNAPDHFFEEYKNFLNKDFFLADQRQIMGISEQFNSEFQLNLLSSENLLVFFEQNNKIENFKNYLKDNNIDPRNYLNSGLKLFIETEKKNIGQKYFLNYNEPFEADDFLNDYIVFTKIKTEKIIIEQLSYRILSEIKAYEQNLNIAKKLGIIKPFLVSEKNANLSLDNQLFYKGTEVLTEQIINLNDLLKRTKELKLNYNPILIKASSSKVNLIDKEAANLKLKLFLSLLVGIIVSFITIYIKSIVKNESYN